MTVGESSMQVKISTTSHHIPIASDTCDFCWENGSTAQGLSLLDSLSEGTAGLVKGRAEKITYAGNWMEGRYATDQICIGSQCIADQMIFVVEEEGYDR